MKPYLKMTEAEKWDHGLRQRPLTMVTMLPASLIPAGGLIYVAVFVDDPTTKKIAWISWAAVTVFLLAVFIAVWRLEERNAITEAAKQSARKALYGFGLVAGIASLVGLFWPGLPLGLRIKLGVVLCGLLSGWHYLKATLSK